jgi:hypothetical protein
MVNEFEREGINGGKKEQLLRGERYHKSKEERTAKN